MTATIICCLALLYTRFPGASQASVVSTRPTGRCTSDKRSSGVRPNGLAFSCRERAGRERQNTNDLAREAVNCNAGLGRMALSKLVVCAVPAFRLAFVFAAVLTHDYSTPALPQYQRDRALANSVPPHKTAHRRTARGESC
jgi:hypothetical protein